MKENISELLEYLKCHDLDEEEYAALESWVNEGNSLYTNPDHYCDMSDSEISYIKWYRILADHLHPDHKFLLNHRHRLKDKAVDIYRNPALTTAKEEAFLNMDYSDTILNPGQDWYIGGCLFLSLEETKKHLLDEMKYIKTAFRKLIDLKNAVEYEMSDLDVTGNLFEDVLNVEELLSKTELFAEEFTNAYRAINAYEEMFRNSRFIEQSIGDDDLPF